MSTRCEIYIEDVEAPGVGAAVKFVYPDGFNPHSPSHQLSNVIRAHLDALAESGDLQKLDEQQDFGDMGAANAQLAEVKAQPRAANEG